MATIVGISVAVLFAGLIFYNAFFPTAGIRIIGEKNFYQNLLIGTVLFFYSNSDDPRFIVPKRTGGGYTFNFCKPITVLLILSSLTALISFLMAG